jgi:hypothetical protein
LKEYEGSTQRYHDFDHYRQQIQEQFPMPAEAPPGERGTPQLVKLLIDRHAVPKEIFELPNLTKSDMIQLHWGIRKASKKKSWKAAKKAASAKAQAAAQTADERTLSGQSAEESEEQEVYEQKGEAARERSRSREAARKALRKEKKARKGSQGGR